jgi:hypothetical protein
MRSTRFHRNPDFPEPRINLTKHKLLESIGRFRLLTAEQPCRTWSGTGWSRCSSTPASAISCSPRGCPLPSVSASHDRLSSGAGKSQELSRLRLLQSQAPSAPGGRAPISPLCAKVPWRVLQKEIPDFCACEGSCDSESLTCCGLPDGWCPVCVPRIGLPGRRIPDEPQRCGPSPTPAPLQLFRCPGKLPADSGLPSI